MEIQQVLNERGSRYGNFDTNAEIAQRLKDAMKDSPSWDVLKPYQKEALEMIQHKISRMLNGDVTYDDNVVDIIGYAELMLEQMRADAEKAKTPPLGGLE